VASWLMNLGFAGSPAGTGAAVASTGLMLMGIGILRLLAVI
jgi:hypothetical protein